jgi:SAM-dependent methyltransferase
MSDIATIADAVSEQAPGYWVAETKEAVSYAAGGHQRLRAVEDSSFWFIHRSACIVAATRRFAPHGTLFDIGGGNGHVAHALIDAGFPTGVVEPGPEGARNAYERGIRPVVCGTTRTAGFLPKALPSVGMFDVLEHIEHDGAFLRELRELILPGGRLYLTVPAYRWLWSVDDERAGHHRRYTIRRLRSVVAQAGFELEYATHLFRFLPLPVLLFRSVPSRLGRRRLEADASGHHTVPSGLAGRLLTWLLARELDLVSRGKTIRFGSSILLVARKPE